MEPIDSSKFPCLLTAEQIGTRVTALAKEISDAFGPGPITMLSLLKGSFVFTSDLARALSNYNHRLRIEFISASSYGTSTESSGDVRIRWHGELPAERDRLLIIDDILDTGMTLSQVKEFALKQKPAMCKIAVLLDKPSRRKVSVEVEFIGFTIEDHFVVGYGLDYSEWFRELPFLAILPLDQRS